MTSNHATGNATPGRRFGNDRDYAIYTSWVNGATQASIACSHNLSANRVHQIIRKFIRHYDDGVGSEFYSFVERTHTTRPLLFSVGAGWQQPDQLLCSVVAVSHDWLLDTNLRSTLARFASHSELTWAVRKGPSVRQVTEYLNSLLEET